MFYKNLEFFVYFLVRDYLSIDFFCYEVILNELPVRKISMEDNFHFVYFGIYLRSI